MTTNPLNDLSTLGYLTDGLGDVKGSVKNPFVNLSGKKYLPVSARVRYATLTWAPQREAILMAYNEALGVFSTGDTSEILPSLEALKVLLSQAGYTVKTDLLHFNWDTTNSNNSYAVVKVSVTDPFGAHVENLGWETHAGFDKGFIEKACTSALGRCLALLGFSSNALDAFDVRDEDDFARGVRPADSPVEAHTSGSTPATTQRPQAASQPAQATTAPKPIRPDVVVPEPKAAERSTPRTGATADERKQFEVLLKKYGPKFASMLVRKSGYDPKAHPNESVLDHMTADQIASVLTSADAAYPRWLAAQEVKGTTTPPAQQAQSTPTPTEVEEAPVPSDALTPEQTNNIEGLNKYALTWAISQPTKEARAGAMMRYFGMLDKAFAAAGINMTMAKLQEDRNNGKKASLNDLITQTAYTTFVTSLKASADAAYAELEQSAA